MKLQIPAALVLLTTFAAAPVLGQDVDARTTDTELGYTVDFMDNDELSGTIGSVHDIVNAGHHAPLSMLLRPRGSFVPEILESVESM
jgi:hypothetical protein